MNEEHLEQYRRVRSGSPAAYRLPRGLIAVWGKEAVQFLDGMITNDMKTLADGAEMLSAFPNAQGRLLAVVRVFRQGERFLIETEGATRERLFQNLYRFTFAGDFFAEDLSGSYTYFEVLSGGLDAGGAAGRIVYWSGRSTGCFVPSEPAGLAGFEMVDPAVYEVLRIEHGQPMFGVDMDETTIVPELGLDGLISYTKGCYIGQEIIARIHFRGHVAKSLTGLTLESNVEPNAELTSPDGKPAGRVTSAAYSPRLEKTIALAYVRHEHLAENTTLTAGEGVAASVTTLPFV